MTPATLAPINLSEFAARVALHGDKAGSIFALIADAPGSAEELQDELNVFSEQPVRVLAAAKTAEATIHALIGATETLTILSGLHVFTAVDWTEFDQLRNRLLQAGTTVMVMPLKTLGLLQDLAPNLSSWLGGRVWRWDESAAALSPQEIEARLMKLRAWSGKSDDEVVALAKRGALPAEPEYAEWLVLLGQGGLL